MTPAVVIWTFRLAGVALAIGGLVLIWRGLFRDRSRGRRRCPKCWYELGDLSGVPCPECGRTAPSERRLLRTRRHPVPVLLGLGVLAGGVLCPRVPEALRDWWRILPAPVLLLVLQVYDAEGDQVFARTAGLAQGGARLSEWERLLLARACGRTIRKRIRFLEDAHAAAIARGSFDTQARSLRMDAQLAQCDYVLRTLGGEASPAVADLAQVLRSPRAFVRHFATESLGALGPVNEDVARLLDGALADPSETVAASALAGLARIGPEHRVPFAGTLALLKDTRCERLHHRAVKVLGRRVLDGAPAADALERIAVSHAAGHVRMAAVEAIRRIDTRERALTRLRRVVAAPNRYSRRGAACGLLLLNSPGDAPLVARATREGEERLGAVGVGILARFGDPAVDHLGDLVMDPQSDVALPAVGALSVMRGDAARVVPLIARGLDHPDTAVRRLAIESLANFGPDASESVPVLESLAARDEGLRQDALRAVGVIRLLR